MPYVIIRDAIKLPADITEQEWSGEFDCGDHDVDAYHDRTLVTLYRGEHMTDEQRQDFIRRARINPIEGSHEREPTDIVDFGSRTPLFSKRARDIIENVAPGRYSFFEIETFAVRQPTKRGPNEEILEPKALGTRYSLPVTDAVDCVDYDRTEFRQGTGLLNAQQSMFFARDDSKLVLKAEAIEGRHIWRTPHKGDRQLFISDELHDAFEAAGITGWHYQKCEVQPTLAPAN